MKAVSPIQILKKKKQRLQLVLDKKLTLVLRISFSYVQSVQIKSNATKLISPDLLSRLPLLYQPLRHLPRL